MTSSGGAFGKRTEILSISYCLVSVLFAICLVLEMNYKPEQDCGDRSVQADSGVMAQPDLLHRLHSRDVTTSRGVYSLTLRRGAGSYIVVAMVNVKMLIACLGYDLHETKTVTRFNVFSCQWL